MEDLEITDPLMHSEEQIITLTPTPSGAIALTTHGNLYHLDTKTWEWEELDLPEFGDRHD